MSDVPGERRAKLELLVRRDGEDGYDVRQVSSAVGWVALRPQRVSADSFELAEVASRLDGRGPFILKNTRNDRFLMISAAERFLWDQMDGRTSVQDIATAYVLRFGQFDFHIIPALIQKLQEAELLTLRHSSRLRQALARHRQRRIAHAAETALTALERINVSSRRVHPLFERLYRWGGFLLFTRMAVVACVALGVGGLLVGPQLWREAEAIAAGLGANPIQAVIVIKLLFFLTVAGHEIVHGLALVHYGRRVREFGFTFMHGFIPTFYVDVTDIFMASRRARLVTAAAGTLVHAVLGSMCFLIAARTEPGFVQAFAATSGIIQWQAFFIALYPFCFIEMDGYHIVADMLGLPTLKQDALAYVGAVLTGRRRLRLTREPGIWLGYVVLSTVSVAAFIAFNVWIIVHAVS